MTEQSSTPSKESEGFKRGMTYAIKHEIGGKTEACVVMLAETWTDFGTMMETFRSIARKQDRELKETKNLLSVCQLQLGDTMQKLQNLRAIRKKEKRPEVEDAVHKLIGNHINE